MDHGTWMSVIEGEEKERVRCGGHRTTAFCENASAATQREEGGTTHERFAIMFQRQCGLSKVAVRDGRNCGLHSDYNLKDPKDRRLPIWQVHSDGAKNAASGHRDSGLLLCSSWCSTRLPDPCTPDVECGLWKDI